MKGQSLKVFAVICALAMVLTALAGCNGSTQQPTAAPTTAAATTAQQDQATTAPTTAETATQAPVTQNYWDMLDTVKDSSDLPTWTGKQLKLTLWDTHGVGGGAHPKATQDVVQAEIKRVTGVEIDIENSFDNGGNPLQTKLDLLAAANDWPNLFAVTDDQVTLKDLMLYNKLYDLTDLIPQYAPHINKIFFEQKDGKNVARSSADWSMWTAGNLVDKLYWVPAQGNAMIAKRYSEEQGITIDTNKWFKIDPPQPDQQWVRIWIRDDILKAMYPDAMTQDEVEAAYVKNGTFTEDQLGPEIKTADDWWKFVYNLKDTIAKGGFKDTNGKPVEVTYAATGQDNWQLMAVLMPWVYGYGSASTTNYTCYYDGVSGKMEWSYDKDFFKNALSLSAKAVRDGVFAPESLLDTNQIFTDKVNSGHYAITYAWTQPDPTTLKKAGAAYRYRYLWVTTPIDYNRFPVMGFNEKAGYQFGISKDSVAEEDLPQILHYMDFCESTIGDKLYNWGPKSAGLFTEDANGNRTFTDKDLEQNMVFGVDNQKNLYYGLYNAKVSSTNKFAWPMPVVWADASTNSPQYTYNVTERAAGDANIYFNPGIFPGKNFNDTAIQAALAPFEWDFPDVDKAFQDGRDAFEKSITKTLTAKDDANFDQLYAAMVSTGQSIGLNADLLAATDKVFKDANKDYADVIPGFKK